MGNQVITCVLLLFIWNCRLTHLASHFTNDILWPRGAQDVLSWSLGRIYRRGLLCSFCRRMRWGWLLRCARLEANPIFLRGAYNVASDVLLQGALVLCLSEPLHNVRSIRLRFTGDKKMKYANVMVDVIWPGVALTYLRFIDLNSHNMWQDETERIAYRTCECRLSESGETLEAGNYSIPFVLAFPGDTVRVSFPARVNDNRNWKVLIAYQSQARKYWRGWW